MPQKKTAKSGTLCSRGVTPGTGSSGSSGAVDVASSARAAWLANAPAATAAHRAALAADIVAARGERGTIAVNVCGEARSGSQCANGRHGRARVASSAMDACNDGPNVDAAALARFFKVRRSEHRRSLYVGVLWFVAVAEPDVFCVQECDNFEFLSERLGEMGYACAAEGAAPYVPLKDRAGATYAEKLNASRFAFAPKTDAKPKKKGKSNARFFLENRTKGPICGKAYGTDDDGTAVFWKASRLKLVDGPEFRVLPGEKDVEAYATGAAEELRKISGDLSETTTAATRRPSGSASSSSTPRTAATRSTSPRRT